MHEKMGTLYQLVIPGRTNAGGCISCQGKGLVVTDVPGSNGLNYPHGFRCYCLAGDEYANNFPRLAIPAGVASVGGDSFKKPG
jgi:hypothetical protein